MIFFLADQFRLLFRLKFLLFNITPIRSFVGVLRLGIFNHDLLENTFLYRPARSPGETFAKLSRSID